MGENLGSKPSEPGLHWHQETKDLAALEIEWFSLCSDLCWLNLLLKVWNFPKFEKLFPRTSDSSYSDVKFMGGVFFLHNKLIYQLLQHNFLSLCHLLAQATVETDISGMWSETWALVSRPFQIEDTDPRGQSQTGHKGRLRGSGCCSLPLSTEWQE